MSASLTKSSPHRPNPNARSSEMNYPIRRSFSGNPFSEPSVITNPRGYNSITPANISSDFVRRNSFSRGSVEDKENGNDQNLRTVRIRSPAASKGSKNFMSPTISAASKVTASPKKKVLVERNESVRTSVASSEGKGPNSVRFSDFVKVIGSDQEMDLDQNETEDCIDTSTPVGLEYMDTNTNSNDVVTDSVLMDDSLYETVILEPEGIDTSSKVNLLPPSPCPLAALDADPYVLPYDPKTNFLSPRPQFLHYRPNPRIEIYRGREGEGTRLEDSFLSECSSDTEVTEETQSEDVSEAEMMKEEHEQEEELDVSSPASISTPLSMEIARDKMESKTHFFTKWKALAVILLLLFAGLSVSIVFPSVLKDSCFSKLYDPSEIGEFAEANFNSLAQNSHIWTAKFLTFISMLNHDIGVPRLEPLKYSNLTGWNEDRLVGGHSLFSQKDYGAEEKFVQNVFGPIWEIEIEEEQYEEEGSSDMEEDVGIEEHDNGGGVLLEENGDQEEGHLPCVDTEVPVPEAEHQESVDYDLQKDVTGESTGIPQALVIQPEVTEDLSVEDYIHDNLERSELDNAFVESPSSDFKGKSIEISQAPVIQPEVSKTEELRDLDDMMHFSSETDSIKDEENLECSELDDSSVESLSSGTMDIVQDGSENKVSMNSVVGILVLVFALCVAATAFTYMRKAETPAHQPLTTIKKFDISPKSENIELALHEKLSSRNWPTELDMVGEPCPSEMSSLQKTPSYVKQELKAASSKAQSLERKVRNKRESLAPSSDLSMISPSYGSFTTYERIPKHGLGEEEEVVTPVRRSSRIRKQVTSP